MLLATFSMHLNCYMPFAFAPPDWPLFILLRCHSTRTCLPTHCTYSVLVYRGCADIGISLIFKYHDLPACLLQLCILFKTFIQQPRLVLLSMESLGTPTELSSKWALKDFFKRFHYSSWRHEFMVVLTPAAIQLLHQCWVFLLIYN